MGSKGSCCHSDRGYLSAIVFEVMEALLRRAPEDQTVLGDTIVIYCIVVDV